MLFVLACSPEVTTEPTVVVRDLAMVVPSAGLPPEVVVQDANNNLDIAMHVDRLFLAWRTAPSHFASEATQLYVVSTTDEQSWRFEGSFSMGTDLREPRFLAWQGRLFLYFAELGDDVTDFEPKGAWVSEWLAESTWSDPAPLMEEYPGFIPWRAKVIDDVPYLIGYTGGENIYDLNGEPLQIYLLTTNDGFSWFAAAESAVVDEGGGSETDFVIRDDGGLIAVERDEAGSETGFGSRICAADAGSWSEWRCVGDPRKYDSPLLFEHGDDIYLIGRRNLTETGAYDLQQDDLSPQQQALEYQLDYWQNPKRCALWKVDPDALRVDFVLDLPSQGDTCFASALPQEDGSWLVYNYSSPLDGDDPSWIEGQNGLTNIYRMILDIP